MMIADSRMANGTSQYPIISIVSPSEDRNLKRPVHGAYDTLISPVRNIVDKVY